MTPAELLFTAGLYMVEGCTVLTRKQLKAYTGRRPADSNVSKPIRYRFFHTWKPDIVTETVSFPSRIA